MTQSPGHKAREFLKLHQGPKILVLANVWDVASARIVESAGFPALATSSAAIANSLGYPDGQRISRGAMLEVVQRIAAKVSVPVSADLEAAYHDVAATARALVEAGAVGLNFEDSTGNPASPLADVSEQCARIELIRSTGEKLGVHIVINARTDVYIRQAGEPASLFEHAISRANTYRQAGADCLFVPGVRDAETIGRLVLAIEGPVNILAVPGSPSVPELERLGVRRVSLGSGPMRAVMGLVERMAREVLEHGTYTTLAEYALPYDKANKLLE